MRRLITSSGVLAALLALMSAPASATPPAALVHPFAGTQPSASTFGGGHNYPGATLPFGMAQFSPDTTPADLHSGGYDSRDGHIRGFSLTQLSGAGCALYGDFPFLPTTTPLRGSPAPHGAAGLGPGFRPGFRHSDEIAHPGYYSVVLDPGRKPIHSELTATTRTGLGRFTFPRGRHSSVLINAGGSAKADDLAQVGIDPGAREITGTASSGYFCAQRPRYRVYFAAHFDRPFRSYGTWDQQTLSPGSTSASDQKRPSNTGSDTAQAGAYATFDTRRNRTVRVRVGISFVSVAGAEANLAAEDPGFDFGAVAASAQRRWNAILNSIRIGGGRSRDQAMFYTALYHSLLAPRTLNDVDGTYPGMDGQLHNSGGHTQYADFSGWDIYRSEIQLLSILSPGRASDMVRSLLTNAAESGCLGRWPYANGQSMTMIGDPADPIIASAAAFGATDFDTSAALAAMVKGATGDCRSANGSFVERPGLDQYSSLGYLPYDIDTKTRNANSLFGSPDSVWGSAATTLEYALADSAIAQFAARTQHDSAAYSYFIGRSANWRNLFNPASGQIEPRYASGAFAPGYDNLNGGGFVEGDSVQYTWLVPQDPAGLFAAMGGDGRASSRLDHFLRILNASVGGTHTDHALLGDEPTLNTPWLYDWAGKPFKTQATVRRAILSLYSPTRAGYPGNDDLGEMSSWWIFGALGLYPQVPGVGLLAIGSPLFPHASLRLGGGRRLRISAPQAAPGTPYVRALRLNGHAVRRPWTSWCSLARGGRLAFTLGRRPKPSWGAAPPPP